MTPDEQKIRELHEGFLEANSSGDTAFLREHMVDGPDALTWWNLNQSNYIGVDHIVELWKMLTRGSGGKRAKTTPSDERITVNGDSAWVTYGLRFQADFGALGQVDQGARATEIWQRLDGRWRMVHFHCSNHVPGVMAGI